MIFLTSLAMAAAAPVPVPMNGEYHIANAPAGTESQRAFHRGKFIEVYSENISTVYSEVYWTVQSPVPLPSDFVAQYKGKVVAFTGYEVDSVRTAADGTETSVPITDQYNHHYNAYVLGEAATMVDVGSTGRLGPHGRERWEPRDIPWIPRAVANVDIATGGFFVDGNGGEYRKSLHYTAQGYAILVDSPKDFQVQPMMINTNDRASGKGPGTWDLFPKGAFGRARNATAPVNPAYNGLLECPCTTRIKKIISEYQAIESGYCSLLVDTAQACFNIPNELGLQPVVANSTVRSSLHPAGCFVQATQKGYEVNFNSNVTSKFPCGQTGNNPTRSMGSQTIVGVTTHLELDSSVGCQENFTNDLSGAWNYPGMPFGPDSKMVPPFELNFKKHGANTYIIFGTSSVGNPCAVSRCTGVLDGGALTVTTASGDTIAGTVESDWSTITLENGMFWERSASFTLDLSGEWEFPGSYGPNGKTTPSYGIHCEANQSQSRNYTITGTFGDGNPCIKEACVGFLAGSTFTMTGGFKMTAQTSMDWSTLTWTNGAVWRRARGCPGLATIKIAGPNNLWFGVGFGAQGMGDQPYAIIIDGLGEVTERRLGDHEAGKVLANSITVVSNLVANGTRTVVAQRPLKGASELYFTFDSSVPGLPLISAVGSTPTFSYHKARSAANLMLVEVAVPLCICSLDQTFGKVQGSIDGIPFDYHCSPEPRSSLLKDKNDICDIRTYEGGLKCCSHGTKLLDADQAPPPAIDTYRMKFRFYYEDYVDQQHAFFMFITGEDGAGEHDVPQCPANTPLDECVHAVSSVFKVRDSMRQCNGNLADVWCAPNWNESQKVVLLRAGAHCHAPACINETLTIAATGEVICVNHPLIGQGVQPQMDEYGYLAGVPPCLWGRPEEGLSPPPSFSLDTELRMVKFSNATSYHYGDMAQWQLRGAWDTQQ